MTNSNAVNGRFIPPFIERFGVSIGTLVLIIAQTIAIVGWLVNDHAQIVHLTDRDGRQEQRLDMIDNNGTRASNVTTQRITQIEAIDLANSRQVESLGKRLDDLRTYQQTGELTESKLQAQIDLLKQEDSRIEDQQTRILQSLDNTYNLLQEHLRAHEGNHEKGSPSMKFNSPR